MGGPFGHWLRNGAAPSAPCGFHGPLELGGHPVDDAFQEFGVHQQRRDVLEDNAFFGKIRDVTDGLVECF